jgi:hypothetical protein
MAAAMKALVRKLLVRVHPDVVASQSDKYRTHNEKALKALLGCLEANQTKSTSPTERSPTIFFYLREGGQTSSVRLDYTRPERTVRELLGLPSTDDETERGAIPTKQSLLDANQNKLTKEEMSKIFNEAMDKWWASREYILTEIDLLFKQDRIRFAPDGLDLNAPADLELDRAEINHAVELAKETLEFHVEDTTAQALQHPKLLGANMVIVARNFDDAVRKDQTLFVPLEIHPEIFGEEIDALVDSIVEKAMQNPSTTSLTKT